MTVSIANIIRDYNPVRLNRQLTTSHQHHTHTHAHARTHAHPYAEQGQLIQELLQNADGE